MQHSTKQTQFHSILFYENNRQDYAVVCTHNADADAVPVENT